MKVAHYNCSVNCFFSIKTMSKILFKTKLVEMGDKSWCSFPLGLAGALKTPSRNSLQPIEPLGYT